MKRIAPNLDLYLWRPVLSDPPLCSATEIEVITLSQLMDMHEVLDLKAALAERARERD